MSEPELYRLLTFHIPNLISIFLSLGHLSKESVQVTNLFFMVRSSASHPTPKLVDHPLSASETPYSIYSQLPPISGGHLLHPLPADTTSLWQETHLFLSHHLYLSILLES
jgi:hypothetical protein